MCFGQSTIVGLNRYNWDGERIYFDPIVPSHRAVIGKTAKTTYELDVREFLTANNNAVIRKVIEQDVFDYAKSIGADLSLLAKRGDGGFDFRAMIIAQFVGNTIKYHRRKQSDPWRFPEETLMIKQGDCEDIAFLLASLLLASGISAYNFRVALGKIKIVVDEQENVFDHAWVMYKRESGKWMVLEPLDLVTHRKPPKSMLIQVFEQPRCRYHYMPNFLCNTEHLWVVDNNDHQPLKDMVNKVWQRMDPRFAGFVHYNIIHAALSDAPAWLVNELDRRFTHIVPFIDSTIVDQPDWPSGHHPYDHFDSGFIQQAWDRVGDRLSNFKANHHAIGNFAWAAHGIADFYAHSSYVHFAKLINPASDGGYATLYDPANPTVGFETTPQYTKGLFDFNRFSINTKLYPYNHTHAAKDWEGQIISGRYGLQPDSRPKDVFEKLIRLPTDITSQPDFSKRSGLPHHNEIAVDQPKPSAQHRLYQTQPAPDKTDREYYANQYRWRYFSAIQHIRQSFWNNWKP